MPNPPFVGPPFVGRLTSSAGTHKQGGSSGLLLVPATAQSLDVFWGGMLNFLFRILPHGS